MNQKDLPQEARSNPWLVLMNLILVAIAGLFSTTSGFLAAPITNATLNLSNDQASWISISLIMTLGTILPLSTFLAEKYGYKLIYMIGLTVFMLGSLCNVLSWNFWSFFISRAMAGAGIGMAFPLSITIINKSFSNKMHKGIGLSLYSGLGFGIGIFLGLSGAGYFIKDFSWKMPYFISFLAGFPLLFTTSILHKETPQDRLRKFDFKGYFYCIAVISLIFMITVNGKASWNTQGWSSPYILTCVALLIFCLVLLIWTELTISNPIINLSLFKIKSFTLGCIVLFTVGFFLYATQMLGVIFFNQMLNYEIHTVGNYLGTLGISMGICTLLSAVLMRMMNLRIVIITGLILIIMSCWINSSITLYSPSKHVLAVLNLRIFGVALAIGPTTALAMLDIPPALSGSAAIILSLIRQIGGTFGSSIDNLVILIRSHFHNQILGTSVQTQSTVFQETCSHLKHHLMHDCGTNALIAPIQAKAILAQNIVNQSLLMATNDFFIIAGKFAFIVSLALICEWIYLKRLSLTLKF